MVEIVIKVLTVVFLLIVIVVNMYDIYLKTRRF